MTSQSSASKNGVPSSACLRFTLSDGARLGYNVFGSDHQANGKLPIVLIGGMSSLKSDWERLTAPLSQSRLVLVFDHRGIGDSTYSTPARNDLITIETMAHDLLDLISHLGWKDIDILGFSMGGVILQQLLLISNDPVQENRFPFHVHHAILAGTLCSPTDIGAPAPQLPLVPKGQRLSIEQKKTLVQPFLNAALGPEWVARTENKARYEWWLEQMIQGRPQKTILKQREALGAFDFSHRLHRVSPSIRVLVIHGQQDLIMPFSAGNRVLESIPHAQTVGIGACRGQLPNHNFGHMWHEYFSAKVWTGVIEEFVDDADMAFKGARL